MKLFLLIAFGVAFSSCQSHKSAAPMPATFILLLADGYDGSYLEKNYHSDGFVEASRNNRTTNSYRASFNSSDVEALKTKLSSDPIIIELTSEDSAPSNGTNVGHSTSKPVIKHKQ
ncbi:MAG: hypothetical protein NWR73_03190 [Flavobacteriales bacterium]|nr:hypothetical protein [Flavobacteriales bacterium]